MLVCIIAIPSVSLGIVSKLEIRLDVLIGFYILPSELCTYFTRSL